MALLGKWSRENHEEAWAVEITNTVYFADYCYCRVNKEDPDFDSDVEIRMEVTEEKVESTETKVGGGKQGKRGDGNKTKDKKLGKATLETTRKQEDEQSNHTEAYKPDTYVGPNPHRGNPGEQSFLLNIAILVFSIVNLGSIPTRWKCNA